VPSPPNTWKDAAENAELLADKQASRDAGGDAVAEASWAQPIFMLGFFSPRLMQLKTLR